MIKKNSLIIVLISYFLGMAYVIGAITYPIVDTGQVRCYNDKTEINFPSQGDVIRIYNHVLCVRGGEAMLVTSEPVIEMKASARG